MRTLVLITLLFPLWCIAQVNIIPKPDNVVFKPGYFRFKNGLSIKMSEADEVSTSIQKLFAERLFNSKEWKVPAFSEQAKNIVLKLIPGNHDGSEENYRIRVSVDSILVESKTYRGLFYGCQSVTQLVINSVLNYEIPCVEIIDTPQYQYRGMHLDVCRHFFPKEVVKQYIDLLGQLKMNVFHLHLTDDQAWRIEIKKYPKLTEVGGWRTEKDGKKYGGFYTQNDIQEIVAYAKERFVTVIPEIEIPGHSSAAIAAYPWLGCNPAKNVEVATTWGIKKDIYCPADSTFNFLKDVLDEVCALFPGKYIHLGGDEAPKEQWKKSAVAQALIKKENLKNEEELQHYFMKLMEDYLITKGKLSIGWGEIVKGGLSDSVVVMSWLDKKAGIKAAEHGNKVIMTPRFFCYFDYPQKLTDKKQAWWMVYLPLRKVYSFNPGVKSLSPEKQKLILGGQANVWTEYMPDQKQLSRRVMPRLAAMAEALWSKDKDFEDFKAHLDMSSRLFTIKYP